MRKQRRLKRRKLRLYCRVSQRSYSQASHFFRVRMRTWHDWERLKHLTRTWIANMRAVTLMEWIQDMWSYQLHIQVRGFVGKPEWHRKAKAPYRR